MSSSAFKISGALCALAISSHLLIASTPTPVSTSAPNAAFLGTAPLYFEAHDAQGFVARGNDCLVSITPTMAEMVLTRRASSSPLAFGTRALRDEAVGETRMVRLTLLNANPASAMRGINELPGKANYLVGNDAAQWRTGISLFSKVKVDAVYPGIDLVYYADHAARLEYDFILHPGARVDQISFRIEGADKMRINRKGELVLKIGAEEIRQHAPVIYQNVNGSRKSVDGGYRLLGRDVVAFWAGEYDRNLALIIDPVVSFSTYLGGSKTENGLAIATDSSANVYVAGESLSRKLFPTTAGALQPDFGGGIGLFGDGFVAKYDAMTRELVYLTYFGGRHNDAAWGLTVDDEGNAYITGFTDSLNFPIVPENNPLALYTMTQSGRNNNARRIYPINVFVSKLNPAGNALEFSTLIGGNRREAGSDIAIDGSGIYVTGMTESTNFPVIPSGTFTNYQPFFGGRGDAFISKLNLTGTELIYSTFIGGTNLDFAESIAVNDGSAYITGYTSSTNFPVRNWLRFANATSTNIELRYLNMQPKRSSRLDAFVTRLSADGTDLVYSTYLGGTNDDSGLDIAVDAGGNAYVTGYTYSRVFPTNTIATPRSTGSNYNSHVFLTKIEPNGSNLVYSIDFGSSRLDRGTSVALNDGRVYLAGIATWTNIFAPGTYDDLRSTNTIRRKSLKSHNDVFLTSLQETGGTFPLTFNNSLLFGGTGSDIVNGLAVRTVGADPVAWIVGQTTSRDLTITNLAAPDFVQPILGNGKKSKGIDAFVGEFQFPPPAP